ncbi:MAG: type I-B CRISPR-associated protein Cas8b/Csh1 [Methanothermobacter sp.]|nr:type I-B CRISPR-associated protein Cas8b/Csh1 [Methanothermobacter sp.]
MGDFDIFRRILKEEARKKFFKAHGVESKGDGKCYLCGNEGEVYGFASPFSVFTVDKKGFAPQFLRENSWKQLPICEGCAVSLIVGKEFLDKYLSKRFYGYKFYVIPSFTFGDIQDEVISEIKDLEKGEYRKTFLLVEEDEILDIIKEKEDIISLIFVFYKTKQKDYFDIVKYVEDVPPSWIKKLLDTFNEIGRKQIFKEEYLKKIFEIFGNKWANDFIEGSWNGKKEKMDLGGITRTFFPASKETGIYDKYFIDIIGDILAQRNINSDFLITAFIREIRSKHVNSDEFKERLFALKSLYLLSFIDKLGLIEGGDKMGENKKEKIELKHEKEIEKVERFFKEFENAFDRADKKAVFLEGVLARFLLNVQKNYYGRSSAPFRSKLHGLKLDKKKVRKLLPEMVEKLAQYKEAKSYYSEYPWLKELVSKYLIYADNDGWSISKDEISYYFALGLNLADIFKDK